MSSLKEQLDYTQNDLTNLKKEYQEFVYAVSHDLDEVLRAVSCFSQIIEADYVGGFDEQAKVYFDFIANAGKKGQEIQKSLKSFSRLNTRAKKFAPVDCNDSVNNAQEVLSDLISLNKAQIDVSNLPVIQGDFEQIDLMFFHLLQNALIYQKENNQPSITLSADDKKDHWEFCLKDNGIGVRESLTEKIFQMMKRGEGNEYPGTGMGLAIVKKIIQRHGGDIWVKSVKDGGTAFHFTIKK